MSSDFIKISTSLKFIFPSNTVKFPSDTFKFPCDINNEFVVILSQFKFKVLTSDINNEFAVMLPHFKFAVLTKLAYKLEL